MRGANKPEEVMNYAGRVVDTVIHFYHKGIMDARLSAQGVEGAIKVPQNHGRYGMEAYTEGVRIGRQELQIAAQLASEKKQK